MFHKYLRASCYGLTKLIQSMSGILEKLTTWLMSRNRTELLTSKEQTKKLDFIQSLLGPLGRW